MEKVLNIGGSMLGEGGAWLLIGGSFAWSGIKWGGKGVWKGLEREKERVQKEAEELKKQQEAFIMAPKAAGAFNRYVPGKYSLFGNITQKSHENKDKDINNETK